MSQYSTKAYWLIFFSMWMLTLAFFVAIQLFIPGCCPLFKVWCPRCPVSFVASLSAYKIGETHKTPKGLRLDLSELPAAKRPDFALLDARVGKMVQCLEEKAQAAGYFFSKENREAWGCSYEVRPTLWHWDCPVIKVVEGIVSPCSDQLLLKEAAPTELCTAKGLPVDPRCPCRWRTLVQSGMYVITTEAIHLWELARLITRCENLWASPMAMCLTP